MKFILNISCFIFKTILYWGNSIVVFIFILAFINYNLVANESVNEYMEDYGFEKFTIVTTFLRKNLIFLTHVRSEHDVCIA